MLFGVWVCWRWFAGYLGALCCCFLVCFVWCVRGLEWLLVLLMVVVVVYLLWRGFVRLVVCFWVWLLICLLVAVGACVCWLLIALFDSVVLVVSLVWWVVTFLCIFGGLRYAWLGCGSLYGCSYYLGLYLFIVGY